MSNRHPGERCLGEHKATPDFFLTDPETALTYLLRAKELGEEDVDVLIEKAKTLLET